MCKNPFLLLIAFIPFFCGCSHFGSPMLAVETTPPGAQVVIDGVPKGRTPLTAAVEAASGEVSVRVELDGYEPAQSSVAVQPGKNVLVVFKLVPSQTHGSLRVASEPAGAEWYLDGVRAGTTPGTRLEVAAGLHQVKVKRAGFKLFRSDVMVVRGKEATVEARLTPGGFGKGRLFVKTEPQTARVRILNIKPKFHQGIDLKSGNYHVEVAAPGYETETMWVSLKSGEDKELEIALGQITPPPPATAPTDPLAAKQTDSGTPGTAAVWKEPATGMELVFVPGDCFQMGCGSWTDDCADDEQPVHEVCLDGFWLGKFEVTEKQWREVMWSQAPLQNGGDHPVKFVSWNDARSFIEKLNSLNGGSFTLRLPTEAEWEYACRAGGKAEKYSGGENVNQLAWHEGNSESTHRAGTRTPNSLGIFDMSGNVYEWCQDGYADSAYSSHSHTNPVNDRIGAVRVMRGGSWISTPTQVRCSDRGKRPPDTRNRYLGLRLARTP